MGSYPQGLSPTSGSRRTESRRTEYGVFPKARLQPQTAGLQTFWDMRKNLGFESQKSWGSDPWLHPFWASWPEDSHGNSLTFTTSSGKTGTITRKYRTRQSMSGVWHAAQHSVTVSFLSFLPVSVINALLGQHAWQSLIWKYVRDPCSYRVSGISRQSISWITSSFTRGNIKN